MGFLGGGGGGGSSGSASGWTTVLDFDWSAVPSANLTGPTSGGPGTQYSVTSAGTTTILANVINAPTAGIIQTVAGVGLRFTPPSASEIGARTTPLVSLPLNQFSGWTPDTPIRAWAWIRNANCSANYDFVMLAIDSGVANTSQVNAGRGYANFAMQNQAGGLGAGGARIGAAQTINIPGEVPGGLLTTSDVLILDMPRGAASMAWRAYVSGSSHAVKPGSPWPAMTDTLTRKWANYWQSLYDPIGVGAASAADQWFLSVTGERVGSGTTLVVDIGRLRLDIRA